VPADLRGDLVQLPGGEAKRGGDVLRWRTAGCQQVHGAMELGPGNRRIALGVDHPLLRPPGPGQQFLIHLVNCSQEPFGAGLPPVVDYVGVWVVVGVGVWVVEGDADEVGAVTAVQQLAVGAAVPDFGRDGEGAEEAEPSGVEGPWPSCRDARPTGSRSRQSRESLQYCHPRPGQPAQLHIVPALAGATSHRAGPGTPARR
jgi:hypothetical protein